MLKLLAPSDDRLIHMLRAGGAGEERALKHLIKSHGAMIKAFIRKNGGSPEDAEEVFYDALTSLLFNLRSGKFEGQSSLGTYLFAIAKRRWYKRFDSMRKKEAREISDPEALAHHEAYEDMAPLPDETAGVLASLLARLDKGCKEVISLWSRQHSMTEIAREMGYKNAQVAMNKKSTCFRHLLQLVEEHPTVKNALAELHYS